MEFSVLSRSSSGREGVGGGGRGGGSGEDRRGTCVLHGDPVV